MHGGVDPIPAHVGPMADASTPKQATKSGRFEFRAISPERRNASTPLAAVLAKRTRSMMTLTSPHNDHRSSNHENASITPPTPAVKTAKTRQTASVSWETHTYDAITSLAFSHSSEFVAAGSIDGRAVVWAVQTGREVARFVAKNPVSSLAFCAEGRLLAVGTRDGHLSLFDLEAHYEVEVIKVPKTSMSTTGLTIAVGTAASSTLIVGGAGSKHLTVYAIREPKNSVDIRSCVLVQKCIRRLLARLRHREISKLPLITSVAQPPSSPTMLPVREELTREDVSVDPHVHMPAATGRHLERAVGDSGRPHPTFELPGLPVRVDSDTLLGVSPMLAGNATEQPLSHSLLHMLTQIKVAEGHNVHAIATDATSSVLAAAGEDRVVSIWSMTFLNRLSPSTLRHASENNLRHLSQVASHVERAVERAGPVCFSCATPITAIALNAEGICLAVGTVRFCCAVELAPLL